MGSFFISAILLLLSLFSYLFARKPEPKAKLPPGSMGWPYIGETLQFYSEDPNVFFATKQKRYGEIVKAHLLGCPCVMLASPEASRFVLVTQAHLFKPTYPKSKEQMIGPWALFFHQGDYHGRLRKLIQSLLAPEAIRRLIPEMETIATSMLESWADGLDSSAFEIMKTFSFDIGILAIFGGGLEESYKLELKKNYSILDKGYNSFPFDFPGTSYSKAIKARRRLRETLDDIMNERRKKGTAEKDLLGYLMDSKDQKGDHLSDDQIADNIIGVLFAAQDTTASALTWILKYLHDDSKLIQALEAEHEGGKRPLTWAQTRTMHLTHRVILEGLRMASIISFTFREAVADVEYKGYLIPKGWKVMPLFRNIHHNPDFFLDPHKFEPSRFETPPKPNTFMPFGNGVHACPGNELAKLEMLVLIHHLVTKYRMEVMGSSSEIQYCPFPVPKHGLQARLQRKFITPDASSTAADTVTS